MPPQLGIKLNTASAANTMRDLTLSPEAEEDLARAFNWYEPRRAGLGKEFFGCVTAALERVVRLPHAFPVVHEPFRRVLVRRFP